MKVKTSSLRFSRKNVSLTKNDRKLKTKLTKKDYIVLLDEANKWPLSMRIAAELWRNGVRLEEFENKFNIDDNHFSKRIYESVMQFHLSKGYDPAIIPPVRPLYLRYVPPAKVSEANAFKGRPSTSEAVTFVQQVIAQKSKDGWREMDFIKAFRQIDSVEEDDIIKVKASFAEDMEPIPKSQKIRYRRVHVFHALVGREWVQATSKEALMRAKENAISSEKIMPVKDFKTHCVYCKFALSELVVTVRDEKGKAESCHMSCYWLNAEKPELIPFGMEVINAKDGQFYRWMGTNQGWVTKKEKPVAPKGVSAPECQEAVAAASVPTPA